MAVQNKKTKKTNNDKVREVNKENKEEKKPVEAKVETAKTTDKGDKVSTDAVKSSKKVKLKVKTLVKVAIVLVIVGLLYMFRNQFIVATVNGEPITRWQLISEMEKQAGTQVLESLISQRLVEQESQKLGIEVSEEQVDQEIENIKEQFAAQGSSFEQTLEAQGATLDEVRKGIRFQLILEKILADSVVVTDEEVAQLFEDFDLGEATPERMAEYRESLVQQKIAQESQIWLQQLRQSSNINYMLFPNPQTALQ